MKRTLLLLLSLLAVTGCRSQATSRVVWRDATYAQPVYRVTYAPRRSAPGVESAPEGVVEYEPDWTLEPPGLVYVEEDCDPVWVEPVVCSTCFGDPCGCGSPALRLGVAAGVIGGYYGYKAARKPLRRFNKSTKRHGRRFNKSVKNHGRRFNKSTKRHGRRFNKSVKNHGRRFNKSTKRHGRRFNKSTKKHGRRFNKSVKKRGRRLNKSAKKRYKKLKRWFKKI